jgi:hypothetical protein
MVPNIKIVDYITQFIRAYFSGNVPFLLFALYHMSSLAANGIVSVENPFIVLINRSLSFIIPLLLSLEPALKKDTL